jgi:uncharacterized pyridoxamine 5'-phosphate oxidase family protein
VNRNEILAETRKSFPIPEGVEEVLKTSDVGYLTVLSKKGDLYSYPVAFRYSRLRVYFVTPVGAAKYKFIKANPTVSFIVDNKKLTLGACGALVQGKAKIFSVAKTLLSILSVAPEIRGFSKKYPGMLSFYARGRELPEERKIYRYRLIRIDPTKIVYWQGYTFGRYVPEPVLRERSDPFAHPKRESEIEMAAELIKSADEELPIGPTLSDHEWIVQGLDRAESQGILSAEERGLIQAYRGRTLGSQEGDFNRTSATPTEEERRLLTKFKKRFD